MSNERAAVHSGGCQCGAVRYKLYAEPYGSHLCHCRMCQKAFGAFYAPLTLIRHEDFDWTRGTPAVFHSSSEVARGFCGACGTPLTFDYQGSKHLNVSIGSLDHPDRVKPETQIGIESRVPWYDQLTALKEETTEQAISPDRLAQMRNHQHPDHDTDDWPA
ncbi:MAG: GFA family protein [Pseudomonadota bacterium]